MKKMEDLDDAQIQEEIVRTSRLLSVPGTPDKSLAAVVVVYRTLGIDKELSILCMHELAKRRQMGSQFDYEAFIVEELSKMPKRQDMNLVKISQDIHKGISDNILKRGKNG